jgi:hypothetical protein
MVHECNIGIDVELRAPNALAPKTSMLLALTLLQKITSGFSDDPGFAEFMQGFNKSYKVPTRQRVAQMAIQRYASQREVLAHALKELEVRPAAILDLWRDLRGRHKLGLSLSFITDEWMQCDVCLAIEDFPEQHTSENIKVCTYCVFV